MGVEIMVPLAFFGAIVGIVWIVSHFNGVKRREVNETIRMAISQGQQLTPEVLDRLTKAADPVRNDLRRGVNLIAIAGALAVLGFMARGEDPDALMAMLGTAAFPGFLGLANIGLWITGRGNKS